MLSLLAALLAASQPAPAPDLPALGRTAWVFATVDESEWCPAGNVRVDLRTGSYSHTPTASRPVCIDRRLERPVSTGRLDAARLVAVRAAYLRAVADGLDHPACRDGGRPQTIVISNAGPRILVLATGARTVSPPDDLSCWSDAANALHELLRQTFAPERRR